MNAKVGKIRYLRGFTIVELLTIMSIIIILMSLLVPSLNKARIYARFLKQKNQFKVIESALALFSNERGEYPDSDQYDTVGNPYSGATRLAEAMVGQDMLGFHPDSRFNFNGGSPYLTQGIGGDLYPDLSGGTEPQVLNIRERKDLFLTLEAGNIKRIGEIYPNLSIQNVFVGAMAGVAAELPVLTDMYPNFPSQGMGSRDVGLPILYFKANASMLYHTPTNYTPGATLIGSGECIYDYTDNIDIVRLGIPNNPNVCHQSSFYAYESGRKTSDGISPNPEYFYKQIWNKGVGTGVWNPGVIGDNYPMNSDSFLLVSAGHDGIYGTKDDVFNFEQ